MGKGRPLPPATTASPSAPAPVPEAPVFRSTEEEFADPLAYVARIRPFAERYGICRIVPPPSWSPPKALDVAALNIPTKRQPIHCLLARPAPADPDTFLLDYARFLNNKASRPPGRGRKPKPSPPQPALSDGRPLDLCRLFHAVKRFGGYDGACEGRRWDDVVRLVDDDATPRHVPECAKHVLAQLYHEHLYDYEKFTSRPPLSQQVEGEKVVEPDDQPSVSGSHDEGMDQSDTRLNASVLVGRVVRLRIPIQNPCPPLRRLCRGRSGGSDPISHTVYSSGLMLSALRKGYIELTAAIEIKI